MSLIYTPKSIPLRMPSSPFRNFNHIKPVRIINRGSRLIDYQVCIELNSRNFPFEKCRTDGADVRFVNEDGEILPYWIESWSKANRAGKIWTRIPKIWENGEQLIFMIFGNPSASSESNGEATFEFFDDFDTDKWTDGNPERVGVDTSNSRMEINTNRNWTDDYSYYSYSPGTNFSAEFDFYYETDQDYAITLVGFTNGTGTFDAAGDYIAFYVYGGASNVCNRTPASHLEVKVGGTTSTSNYWCNDPDYDVWLHITLSRLGDTAYLKIQNQNKTTTYLDVNLSVAGISELNYIEAGGSYTGHNISATSYMDNLRIRKYASPEPVVIVL